MAASALIQKRGRILGSLTKAVTFMDNIDQETTIEDLEARLAKLESSWEEFFLVEDELLLLPQQASKSDEFEEKYFKTQAAMTREIRKRKPVLSNVSNDDLNTTINNMYSQQRAYFESLHDRSINTSTTEVKLPRINIPTFDGKYTEWPSFKDLFEATVHRKGAIPPVHKFQLLKGLLKGEAASLINHLLITDASYNEAWDKLTKRYDKKRRIVSTIIKQFLDQQSSQHSSSKSLRTLTETSDELLRGLKALGPECESRDPWIIHIMLTKLDDETKEQWALHSVDTDMPTVVNFLEFLHRRCDALESCQLNIKSSRSKTDVPKQAYFTARKIECSYCKKPHPLHKCFKFQRCTAEQRKIFANKIQLCVNCLRDDHSFDSCTSLNTCYECKGKHHTLLHDNNTNSNTRVLNAIVENAGLSEKDMPQPETSNVLSYATTQMPSHQIKQAILPTVVMTTMDSQGKCYNVRVLLDSGSESSFITDHLTRKLGLKRKHACVAVGGLSAISAGKTRGLVNIKLSSRFDNKNAVFVEALILGKLTTCLPSQSIVLDEQFSSKLNEYRLADFEFFNSNPIEMILGIDIFYEIVKEKTISIQPNLHLIDTIFGWVIAGSLEERQHSAVTCHTIQIKSDDVCALLRRFWEVEEFTVTLPPGNDDCEEHFLRTHQFVNGRYVVELPFKPNFEQLDNNLKQATSRMIAMERKFSRNPQIKEDYINFMKEYQHLGHMKPISDPHISMENAFYLPHHAVIKQTSSTTKLRVVFDGSSKSSLGCSLNDVLKTGQTIQDDLFSILTRFRRHKVAFVADIEKMYRQVQIHPKHQDFQRIVWREHPRERMQHYKLNTVTYGLTSSAYLAIRSLHQIASDNNQISAKVKEMIKSDFYVDDLLSGCDSEEEAFQLYREITTTLSQAGFSLRQWSSNTQSFVNNIPADKLGRNLIYFEAPENYVKTLGTCWLTNEDAFTFNVPELSYSKFTKRSLLSDCSKIFDPLGWISPVIIAVKILLQSLWLTKLEWDDPLSDDVDKAWCSIRNELCCLTTVRIPRFLHMQPSNIIQYHGFCDASEKAYSAVVYARSTDINGENVVLLIAAKTKVAPLKQLSIPRLELCGAVLLVKLLHKVSDIFHAPAKSIYAWTDSNIVLSWLSDIPRKWNCFVANRTSFIIDKLPRQHWQHVPSNLNPADCASRGILPSELVKHTLWWNGPDFLQMSSSKWPNFKADANEYTTVERRNVSLLSKIENVTPNLISPVQYVIEKFSSYWSILRVLANCIRYTEACRKRKSTYVTCGHLQSSEHIVIKWAQQECFQSEIYELQRHNPIKRSSKLIALHPFLDENGILRVGGRLQNSNIPYSMKHPVILSKQHQLTEKIVRYLHNKHLHPNPSTLLFIIRSKYWIIGGKDVIKRVSSDCLCCIRSRPKLETQIMGSLPSSRVTLTRAFYNVGVDYAGPITIVSRKGRGSKRLKAYVCLFVCMATKAIHIEVVCELSTDEFIAALKRFTGRRGLPKAIHSDNATNFVGAQRRFDEFYKILASKRHNDQVSQFLSAYRIEWHTIPPSAPHFGGLWEAGIKSAKTHLRRVLGESAPTLEELQTLLIQIEAILNSRPLTPMNNDPDDLQILTPGHFLIGTSLLAVPDDNSIKLKLNERWELIQNMFRGFWRRWHIEYLTMLQKRSKWQHQERNFTKGELVLIKDDNTSPLYWARGRVIQVHPGNDNNVRVVTLKTANGELKRPVTKLSKLPQSLA